MRRFVFFLLLTCVLCAAAQIPPATPPTTQVTLTASSPVALAGTLVTFTATVSGTPVATTTAAALPTGTITFEDGTTPIGEGKLQNNLGLATATFFSSGLSAGSHAITAVYSGDANFAAASSSAVTVAIDSFSITPAATSLTLTQGESGTIVYTVADASSFNTAVQFACQAPANTFTSCTFSPSTITGNGQAVLTITTSTSGSAAAHSHELFSTGGGLLACLLFCCAPVGMRFRRRLGRGLVIPALLLVLLFGGMLGLSGGCGSSSSTVNAGTPTPTGTQVFEVITATTANGQTVGQDTWITVNVLPAS